MLAKVMLVSVVKLLTEVSKIWYWRTVAYTLFRAQVQYNFEIGQLQK